MPSPQPLRSPATIRAVLRSGRARHRDALVVHANAREEDGPARVAVVAGRKVGGAVQRNRAKRRLRAALCEVTLPDATDFVVVARAAVLDMPYRQLVGELEAGVRPA